jgi:hypothetical protein
MPRYPILTYAKAQGGIAGLPTVRMMGDVVDLGKEIARRQDLYERGYIPKPPTQISPTQRVTAVHDDAMSSLRKLFGEKEFEEAKRIADERWAEGEESRKKDLARKRAGYRRRYPSLYPEYTRFDRVVDRIVDVPRHMAGLGKFLPKGGPLSLAALLTGSKPLNVGEEEYLAKAKARKEAARQYARTEGGPIEKAQGGIAGLPIVRAQSGMGFTAALGPGGGISGVGFSGPGGPGGPGGSGGPGPAPQAPTIYSPPPAPPPAPVPLAPPAPAPPSPDGGPTTVNWSEMGPTTRMQAPLAPTSPSAPVAPEASEAFMNIGEAVTSSPLGKFTMGGKIAGMLLGTFGQALASTGGYTSAGSPGGQLIDTRYRDYPSGDFPEDEEDGIETHPEESLMPIVTAQHGLPTIRAQDGLGGLLFQLSPEFRKLFESQRGSGETFNPTRPTLVNREFTAAPEDYQHGIMDQWNYYPESGQGTVGEIPRIEETITAQHGYNPSLPTVRMQGSLWTGNQGPGAKPPPSGMTWVPGMGAMGGPKLMTIEEAGGVYTTAGGVGAGPGFTPSSQLSSSDGGTPAVDRGPVQTLSLGTYTAAPEDYQHGIDPQWNYYPESGATTMNTGGMVQDAMRLQAAGTGPHNQLVHMTQGEVDAMNALAGSGIGGLRSNGMAINPQTGLPEAGFFSSILPTLAGIGLTIASGGTAAPWALGLASGAGSLVGQKLEGGEVDMGKAFLAGLGGWGAGKLGNIFGGAGEVVGAQAGAEAAKTAAIQAPGVAPQTALNLAEPATFAQVGWGVDPGLAASAAEGALGNLPASLGGGVIPSGAAVGPDAFGRLAAGLPAGAAKDALVAQYAVPATSDAALMEAGRQTFAAKPSFSAIKEGFGTLDPTSWASSPGTVGLKETLAPGAALAASTADAFGAFDPPEYDWDNEYPDTYDYQGPYLPRPRTAFAPPADYQPGIDPAYQYYSYGNKGGYVGGLPTIRAITGYGRPPKLSPATDMLAAAGAANTGLGAIAQPKGLGFYTTDPRMALRNQLAQTQARPQQVAPVPRQDPLLAAGLAGPRQPTLPGQMPGQQVFARNGGYASDLPTVRMQGEPILEINPMLPRDPWTMAKQAGKNIGNKVMKGVDDPRIAFPTMIGATAAGLPWLKMKQWERERINKSIMPRETQQMREERAKILKQRRDKKQTEGNAGQREPYDASPEVRQLMLQKEYDREAAEEMARSGLRIKAQGGIAGLPTVRMAGGSEDLKAQLLRQDVNAPEAVALRGRTGPEIIPEFHPRYGYPVLNRRGAQERQQKYLDEKYGPTVSVRDLLKGRHHKAGQEIQIPGGTILRQEGGIAGEPVDIATSGLMGGAAPEIQAAVAERDMVMPAPDQPQNAEERAVFDQALLALQGELEPEPAQAAITEFIDTFGPEAFRQLQALVSGERESGGLVQPANGQDTVGMSEEDVRLANQGPDVIPGKIVNPQTGEQTANLRVGEDEYIMPADGLEREAKSAGLPPTAKNGAMVVSEREEQLRQMYG